MLMQDHGLGVGLRLGFAVFEWLAELLAHHPPTVATRRDRW
jgi:hypothetical protein